MRLTIVHMLQVKRREVEDDGEDEEGSGAKLVNSSAAVLLDHIRPDLFQVDKKLQKIVECFGFTCSFSFIAINIFFINKCLKQLPEIHRMKYL